MRIKRGVTKNQKHKKILKLAKGYRMTYSKLYRRAKEAVRHAGQYSYAHRKHRGSQIREQWVEVIAAALTKHEISYSKFIGALKKNNIEIDRKNLAELAVYNPAHFDTIITEIK